MLLNATWSPKGDGAGSSTLTSLTEKENLRTVDTVLCQMVHLIHLEGSLYIIRCTRMRTQVKHERRC